MIDGAFLQGKLEMPDQMPELTSIISEWMSFPCNRILAVISCFLLLFSIKSLIRLYPSMLECTTRWMSCIRFEHSLSLARSRNILAATFILPLGLVVDRFSLISSSYIKIIPNNWSALICIAIILGYLLFRYILFITCRLPRFSSDERHAIHNTLYTTIVIYSMFSLVSATVLFYCGMREGTIQIVLWSIFGISMLMTFRRTGQILHSHLSGFSTFLYLCRLEFLPAGILIASFFV